MSSTLGDLSAAPATRAATPGWRDPRLWIGVVLVAVSIVVGARVVGGADDSVAVWAVGDELGAGDTVDPTGLVAQRVRFADPADAARYLRTDAALPDGLTVVRAVGAGELLPRGALGDAAGVDVVEAPLSVAPGQVPPSVGQGAVVDVWVTAPGGEPGARAVLVLDDVVVVDAPSVAEGFGATGERQLVLAVTDDQTDRLPRALGAAATGAVTVTRQG